MADKTCQTPVLAIVFNRPDKARALISALAVVRPARLFVSADGPREGVPGERELCEETRALFKSLPWDCEVITHFSDKNLGCRLGVSGAISWFFTNVSEGIILEDDCIPSPSFFPYCTELLERYRTDEKVMHINGTTFLAPSEASDPTLSYHFSRIPHVWGWATWKRAWNAYDLDMKGLDGMHEDFPHADFWIKLFKHVRDKRIDTWDAQWTYAVMSNKRSTIMPTDNLIENIGFDKSATHTRSRSSFVRNRAEASFPLAHPTIGAIDEASDERVMKKAFIRGFWRKLMSVFG